MFEYLRLITKMAEERGVPKRAIEPITPAEAMGQKRCMIDPRAVDAINSLIVIRMQPDGSATFTLEELALVIAVAVGLADPEAKETSHETFAIIKDRGWLDIEPIYEQAGWQVKFDKPAYNESYKAFFVFKPKRSRA